MYILILHVFGQFVRIQNTRYGLLYFSLVFGCFFKSFFSLLQIEIAGVVARCLFYLHEKVPQMLFERGQILVEVEEAFDYDSDLGTRNSKIKMSSMKKYIK